MAEYYDIQEVANKLRKTEEEVQELVKQGKLHQYMDSGRAVFKTEDVDALAEEIVGLDISSIGLSPDEGDSEDLGAIKESSDIDILLAETGEITLEPDEDEDENTNKPASPGPDDMELDLEPDQNQKESEGGFGLSQMGDLTMADTNVGTVGINILSGTGDAYQLTEDTKAETSAQDIEDFDELESLDADSNLESFGSGSGLLDLSLQADDTSLGAVLDDILPAGVEEGGAGADIPIDEIGLTNETDDLLGNGQPEESPIGVTAPMGAEPVAIASVAPTIIAVDPKSSVFGVMMFLPLLALIAASIVLTAAIQNVMPALMKPLVEMEMAGISLVWIIVGGLTVLLLIILMFAAVGGGGGGGTKTKKTKVKKEKKPKKAKPAKKKRK